MSLSGKAALVTGAGSGIGRAIALALAGKGAAVLVNDVYLDRAQKVAGEVAEKGVKSLALRADVSHPAEVTAMVREARRVFPRLDILVNNAGIEQVIAFAQMSYEDWRRMLGIHVDGAFNCAREVVGDMIAARWGRVINMSSVAAFMGPDLQVHYATAKAALVGFTKSLARELAPFGVTVNAIAPGLIDTPMARSFSPRFIERMLALTPVGRLGTAEDIAYAALFLASEEASFITGQVISPNGGHWM